jgi:ribosomal protein S18 acetylase RimI-like enzyme
MERPSIRQAVSTDIPRLMAMDHGYSTDHVWQMSLRRNPGEVEVAFREVRLPRPMRVAYPRDPDQLADEWTLKAALLIAETQEGSAGYLSIVDGPAPGSAWITDLVVDPPHRRQGVATQLLLAAREWSRERSQARLFLEMQSKNYPAIRLAHRLGLTFAGYSDHYYPDQEIALFFALDLR